MGAKHFSLSATYGLPILEIGESVGKKLLTYTDDQGEVTYRSEEDIVHSRWDEAKGYRYISNERVLLLKQDTPNKLKPSDFIRLLAMARQCLNNDSALYYRKRAMTASDLTAILGIERTQAYTTVQRLTEHDLIRKFEGVLYVNPFYVTVNRYITPHCFMIWHDVMMDHLGSWAQSKLEGAATP